MLAYKKLDVYRCSTQFLALAAGLVEQLPRGHSALADQLRRAALSIPLNVAEGVGKHSVAEQRRYYLVARGSAMECGAIIDACAILRLLDEDELLEAEALLIRIVGMLTKMCRFR